MVMLKETSCRVCLKIFCCSDCRDVHESSKHPKPKCPLCLRGDLVFKPPHESEKSDRQKELICHVVFNHLPLYCKLCGDKYTSNQELLEAKPCRWWTKISKGHCLKPVVDSLSTPNLDDTGSVISHLTTDTEPSSVIAATPAPSTISASSSDLELTDCVDKKLPATPRIISCGTAANKSLADTSAISRLKQDPNSFDSPPELARQTSTPVHGLGLTNYHHQKQANVAAIPQFMLKTPSSSFDSKRTPSTFDGTAGSACSRGSTGSRYYTGLTSGICVGTPDGASPTLDNNDNICENATEADPSWSSPTYSILKKDDQKKEQQNIDKSFIRPDVIERINESITARDNSEKRVRFSDQCVPPPPPPTTTMTMQEAPADSSAYFGDNDIFFEARESLGEDNNEARENTKKEERIEEIKSEPCACCSRNKGKDSSPVLSTDESNNNNNNNEVKVEKKVQSPVDRSVGDSSKVNTSTSSTSSRVLMMVLVEKSDSKGLSSLDLAPLIDSGLKKLEETMANTNNSSNTHKGTSKHSGRRINAELSCLTRRSSFTEETTQKDYHHRPGSVRASIKDSFVSITDQIECFNASAAPVPVSEELERQLSSKADSLVGAVEPYAKSDGIFSVVARVVRSALNKLPGAAAVGSRNLSREPLPACSPATSFISPGSLSTASISGTSSQLSISSTSGMLAVPPQCVLLQRSASKRPRDKLDSSEDQLMPSATSQRDSPGSSSGNEVISSPVAKRPRGWYRIRAREPIARMRERQMPVSPRGASRETQRFHQGSGSLTIGSSDTFLPLPSRAHQATQTEEKSAEK